MGEVAKTLVELNGPSSVHGVIPAALIRHDNGDFKGPEAELVKHIDDSVYGKTTVVQDMHARKALMASMVYEGGPGSGFIALSGGYGTMEELMEVTTWNQLGIHSRGIAVYNVEGYWDGLLKWIDTAVGAGFVKQQASDIIVEGKTAEEVVDKLLNYKKSEGSCAFPRMHWAKLAQAWFCLVLLVPGLEPTRYCRIVIMGKTIAKLRNQFNECGNTVREKDNEPRPSADGGPRPDDSTTHQPLLHCLTSIVLVRSTTFPRGNKNIVVLDMSLITLATCSLNQWALDFHGNRDRIIEAIKQAKEQGASLLVTPELCITGYGCLDHFLELDNYDIAWEVLADILDNDACQDILFDVGMPICHRGIYYNCRVVCRNRKILLIRPKQSLANDGNFREMRYFTPWTKRATVEDHRLPPALHKITGQTITPFGEGIIEAMDTVIAAESCEELFTPAAPHIELGLAGVEIFTNSSGSHHELRKLDKRLRLIQRATEISGGVYLYSNEQGCDGDRLYYDGCALIAINGKVVAQGSQFSLNDVEVISATVDLSEVRAHRFPPSLRIQNDKAPSYPRIALETTLAHASENIDPNIQQSPVIKPRIHLPEEEIALGPACWLWDYLRRSRQAGFFVPLSGGIDSCSTAVIVFSMCREVKKSVDQGNEIAILDVRRVCGEPEDSTWLPSSPQEICNRLFCTTYMGTTNSSAETRQRAKDLAAAIGAYHTDMNIDTVVTAMTTLFTSIFGVTLRFKVHGGSNTENLALQNIQARLRMVISYLFAQTLPFVRKRATPGGLLVLGSGNVDECLRGYLTKYDCSSADLNPIGAISKIDLKRFIAWAEQTFELPILSSFLHATPTAELEPITGTYTQSDEADMGVTYEELSVFGRLRKVERLGPWGMWQRLVHVWADRLTPRQVYEKVRHFNYFYGINRHKMTTMTPGYHAEQYSPDDNRFDLRPFLYPTLSWAYEKIEKAVGRLEKGDISTTSAKKAQ
ncbi:hypothetical protein FH972_023506 [Carpinus fangiana]|uniref:Glutamine-dependent NAD(+) synthetase n=1 Tax=Carpinus fangiana TaxID=176857 RepID=A0A5N6KVW2_9ROSI|nr:hypothetical protein FH972_023506 [Carpinus fangiana]